MRKITFKYTHENGKPYTAIETLDAISCPGSPGHWLTDADKEDARAFQGTEEAAMELLHKLEERADGRHWDWERTQ